MVLNKSEVQVSDCTLRDTRGAPGVYITVNEACKLAELLDRSGVSEIEAGLLNGSKEETRYITSIKSRCSRANISGLLFCTSSKAIDVGISHAIQLGVNSICISIPTSPSFIEAKLKRSPRAAMILMQKAVQAASSAGLSVTFTGEDAARADINFLSDYVCAGEAVGASRFRFAETVSCLNPNQMRERISMLKKATNIPIEVHCHSAYGLATANTIAAIEAGADWVSVAVDGIGERGGNTPLAPILLYLKKFHNQSQLNSQYLKPLSDLLKYSIPGGIERYAPIVGSDAFSYEIGQQFSSYEIYEDFSPECVGNERSLVFGRKNDSCALEIAFYLSALPLEVSGEVEKFIRLKRRALTRDEMANLLKPYLIPEKKNTLTSVNTY